MRLLANAMLLVFAASVFAQEGTNDLATKYGIHGAVYAKASRYKLTEFSTLKAMKKEYKNKYVQYEGRFTGFTDTFPLYMEKSGFKATKYYLLRVGGDAIPIIARRRQEITQLLTTLKKGTKVRLYGKVKEFRSKPARTMLPHYYVEYAHITVLAEETPNKRRLRK